MAPALRPLRLLPSPRTVFRATLITGCFFTAIAHYTISSSPIYIQSPTSPAVAPALPRWVQWSSGVQVAAAALSLAPPLRGLREARRALSVVAVLAGLASQLALLAFLYTFVVSYVFGACWSGRSLTSAASSVVSLLVGLVLRHLVVPLAVLWF